MSTQDAAMKLIRCLKMFRRLARMGDCFRLYVVDVEVAIYFVVIVEMVAIASGLDIGTARDTIIPILVDTRKGKKTVIF